LTEISWYFFLKLNKPKESTRTIEIGTPTAAATTAAIEALFKRVKVRKRSFFKNTNSFNKIIKLHEIEHKEKPLNQMESLLLSSTQTSNFMLIIAHI